MDRNRGGYYACHQHCVLVLVVELERPEEAR
jgi:hypothetical protein